MAGANLHGGSMEVAFEQWTQQECISISLVGFNGIFRRYTESGIEHNLY